MPIEGAIASGLRDQATCLQIVNKVVRRLRHAEKTVLGVCDTRQLSRDRNNRAEIKS